MRLTRTSDLWWKTAVIYCLDVETFFDADGDGVDDLAARGHGDRSGGLTIMRLDIAARRFVRLVSGFAWEQ